jgi:hypothetical protein
MILSFSQPVFLPWGGFFARSIYSDAMVILDDTYFAHGFTFVNRNRVKSPNGELWITVPIIKKGKGQQKINQLLIYQKNTWAHKFLSTIQHCYSKSIYFNNIFKKLTDIINSNDNLFISLVLKLLNLCLQQLKIKKNLILQSELNVYEKGISLIISIAKKLNSNEIILPYPSRKHLDLNLLSDAGLKITLINYKQIPYPQFWGTFIPNLSILDMLLCCGPASQKIISKSTTFKHI